MKIIGEKVILRSLMYDRDFFGEIIAISDYDELCSVKLDSQDNPVDFVLYYEEKPIEIESSLWQFCYPISNGKV